MREKVQMLGMSMQKHIYFVISEIAVIIVFVSPNQGNSVYVLLKLIKPPFIGERERCSGERGETERKERGREGGSISIIIVGSHTLSLFPLMDRPQ